MKFRLVLQARALLAGREKEEYKRKQRKRRREWLAVSAVVVCLREQDSTAAAKLAGYVTGTSVCTQPGLI